eukprot:CAMPEP_0202899476 /NCGR_PEP_ID=MMETSP1392-20130828/7693_1 /ASSEMBLY_ACC=CAM_ASM_000868 /TAXON_ID=225041 /ORGANISM="Chlamydomonas chlamydogama, Strain SAG 11-48b" /LENGTH=616 /DNA_ID=CAMNT_0049585663 /DNA_START=41 /DNA_END=1891 /DNA_ORIENTATION=+
MKQGYRALLLVVILGAATYPGDCTGCPIATGYTFYPIDDSALVAALGYDLNPLEPISSNAPSALSAVCDRRPGCTAFTTTGLLKNILTQDLEQLKQLASSMPTASCTGVYMLSGQLSGRWSGATVPPLTAAAMAEAADRAALHAEVLMAAGTLRQAQQVAASASRVQGGSVEDMQAGSAPSIKSGGTSQAGTAAARASVSAFAAAVAQATQYPKWDSRDKVYTKGPNWVSPPRNQGSCSTCVAQSTVALAETAVAVAAKANASNTFSPHWLYFCSAYGTKTNCKDGWSQEESKQVLTTATYRTDQALPSEACFPYLPSVPRSSSCTASTQATDRPVCRKQAGKPDIMLGKYKSGYLNWGDELGAKAAIRQYGSVSACFDLYQDVYNYVSGVYRRSASAKIVEPHCVQVVGYDDALRAFLVKNSWGTAFGQQGYFWMPYGGDCRFMNYGIMWISFTPSSTGNNPTTTPSGPTAITCRATITSSTGSWVWLGNSQPWGGGSGVVVTAPNLDTWVAGVPMANRATSFDFTCDCSGGQAGGEGCWKLGKSVTWVYFNQFFTARTNIRRGELAFASSHCTATKCSRTGLTSSLPNGPWDRAISSMAIAFNVPNYTPFTTGH